MAKYLVVHPKLSLGNEGKLTRLKKGASVTLSEAQAKQFVAKGFLELVVAEKKTEKKDKK